MGRTHWLAFSTGSRDKISESDSRWPWWYQRHDHQTKGMRNTDFSSWKPHDLCSVLSNFNKEHRRDERLENMQLLFKLLYPINPIIGLNVKIINWEGEKKSI